MGMKEISVAAAQFLVPWFKKVLPIIDLVIKWSEKVTYWFGFSSEVINNQYDTGQGNENSTYYQRSKTDIDGNKYVEVESTLLVDISELNDADITLTYNISLWTGYYLHTSSNQNTGKKDSFNREVDARVYFFMWTLIWNRLTPWSRADVLYQTWRYWFIKMIHSYFTLALVFVISYRKIKFFIEAYFTASSMKNVSCFSFCGSNPLTPYTYRLFPL